MHRPEYRSEEEWIRTYQNTGALWLHDANPKRPHALLTSGKHSEGFFNSELVMENPILLDDATRDLTRLLVEQHVDIMSVDRVVGPAMGGITMAHDLARHISQQRFRACRRGWTVKVGDKMEIDPRIQIKPGDRILLVEDVITTSRSIVLTAQAVIEQDARVLPYIVTLVNRSGLKKVEGCRIVALIDRPMPMWDSADCSLCQEGSEAIRPKATENWVRLNAAY